MDKIIISDFEVFYCVGVPEEERATPQRLLLSLELELDFTAAAVADDLSQTVNYFAVCQLLLQMGQGRSWKLLESLAEEIASVVMEKFRPAALKVQIKKFIIPQAAYVGVEIVRRSKIFQS
jgi:dihydroneopterin aldolase